MVVPFCGTCNGNDGLKLVSVPLSNLKAYENNSRTHSDAQVKQIAGSIEEFGFTNPLLIDEDKNIIAGHGRLAAAKLLDMKEVPVLVLENLTKTQKKALVIADNKIALNAGWDTEVLQVELESLESEGFKLEAIGFETSDINMAIESLTMPSVEPVAEDPEVEVLPPDERDDEVPEPPKEPDTVLGDVYEIGEHRLMCGDSTSIDDVDKLMDGQKADMVFTDPPYGVSYTNNMNDIHDVIKNDDVFLDFLPVLLSFSKENIHWYIWTSDPVYDVWRDMFKDYFKSTVLWSKGGGGIGDLAGDYARNYEMCLFCQYGRRELNGSRDGAVWGISKDGGSSYKHPTQKPVELSYYAIQKSSNNGENVLDLFGGSGSTMVGAHKCNRKAFLMELDPKYCDVIVKRMHELFPDLQIKRNGVEYTSEVK